MGLVGFVQLMVGLLSSGIMGSQRGIVVVLGPWSNRRHLNVVEKLPGSGLIIESWGCGGCSRKAVLVVVAFILCGRNWQSSDGGLECLPMEWGDAAALLDAAAADLRSGRIMTGRLWWSAVPAVIGFKVTVGVEPFNGIQVIIFPRVGGLLWASHGVMGHQLGGAPQHAESRGQVDELLVRLHSEWRG